MLTAFCNFCVKMRPSGFRLFPTKHIQLRMSDHRTIYGRYSKQRIVAISAEEEDVNYLE